MNMINEIRHHKYFLTVLIPALFVSIACSEVRLKDIARLEGSGANSIVGYGLVIGLNGTGDRYRTPYTDQSLANMLDRFGITIDPNDIRPRNVAAVMVTAEMSPYVRPGSRFDVLVSSIGDATSLAGGTLLPTPLSDMGGDVWANGQGPVSVGGFNIQAGRVAMRKNYTMVGRVPNGGVAVRSADSLNFDSNTLHFNLNQPDFTTAQRVAEALNAQFGSESAYAMNATTIAITPPGEFDGNRRVEFIALAEALTLNVDTPAKVVINERTGTVVVGENVKLKPAAITHGSISIAIKSAPVISQPGPFSSGRTVAVPLDQIVVNETATPLVAVPEGTTVGEISSALNSLGVSPTDLIAIFQALKEAGALQAELVIL
ncbi:flagellar biosynthesis protein FlgA [candidate division LCP-89 bacterium B3_LCP]|uniref:Flagellar P-ring protein n=1 Tax=candidate division LCP-89 bacterium B3_LCP TaxID=2012998 RepID=A0A532UZ96_UNCL8|nr:MAG: flagellar biosynthesis protein FlgA [candidate division LCP-89 bacterium B3_LCP]